MEFDRILVYLISTLLVILLVLFIMSGIVTYKILKVVKSVADKAEIVADNVESMSSIAKGISVPIAITQLLGSVTDALKFKKSKKDRK